jgi:hypothetical protein
MKLTRTLVLLSILLLVSIAAMTTFIHWFMRPFFAGGW